MSLFSSVSYPKDQSSPVSGGQMGVVDSKAGANTGPEGLLKKSTTAFKAGAQGAVGVVAGAGGVVNGVVQKGNKLVSGVVNFVTGKSEFTNVVAPVVNDGRLLQGEYVVAIESKECGTVQAVMQDKMTLSTDSKWEAFNPVGNDQTVNSITQMFGFAPMNTLMSRRMWNGSEPITMSMTLQFWAVSDPVAEVIKPIQALMAMSAPSTGNPAGSIFGIQFKDIFFLNPPGPSPFARSGDREAFKAKYMKEHPKATEAELNEAVPEQSDGDVISIKIGKFMKFDSVIIKTVSPEFDLRLTRSGYPIKAEVRVEFQTYQMLTKEDINKNVFVM